MNASKFTIAIAATLITLLLAGVRAGFSGSTLITHIAAPAKHAV